MLFPIGEKSDEMQGAIILNEESECIYTILSEAKTFDEITAEIKARYDTQGVPIREMLEKLMEQYAEYGVVKVCE